MGFFDGCRVYHRLGRAAKVLKEYMCAARVGWWLCWSAPIIQWCSLPRLCRYASARVRFSSGRLEPSRVIAIVHRVSGAPLFLLPVFPRTCMRRSLALYRELTRMGYGAAIHFGVRCAGTELEGHSWVTLNGAPIGEPHSLEPLSVAYSYPDDSEPRRSRP